MIHFLFILRGKKRDKLKGNVILTIFSLFYIYIFLFFQFLYFNVLRDFKSRKAHHLCKQIPALTLCPSSQQCKELSNSHRGQSVVRSLHVCLLPSLLPSLSLPLAQCDRPLQFIHISRSSKALLSPPISSENF